jgi:hypothetical protein
MITEQGSCSELAVSAERKCRTKDKRTQGYQSDQEGDHDGIEQCVLDNLVANALLNTWRNELFRVNSQSIFFAAFAWLRTTGHVFVSTDGARLSADDGLTGKINRS